MKKAQTTVHVHLKMHVILVKHQVAQGKESMDPEKSPPARCAIMTLHKIGAIELYLQEYTLGMKSQSHEL